MKYVSVFVLDELRKKAGFRTLNDAKAWFVETYHHDEFEIWLKKEAEKKSQSKPNSDKESRKDG